MEGSGRTFDLLFCAVCALTLTHTHVRGSCSLLMRAPRLGYFTGLPRCHIYYIIIVSNHIAVALQSGVDSRWEGLVSCMGLGETEVSYREWGLLSPALASRRLTFVDIFVHEQSLPNLWIEA